jgi:hypothetical protein
MEQKSIILIGAVHCVNCAKTIEAAFFNPRGVVSVAMAFTHEKAALVIGHGFVAGLGLMAPGFGMAFTVSVLSSFNLFLGRSKAGPIPAR